MRFPSLWPMVRLILIVYTAAIGTLALAHTEKRLDHAAAVDEAYKQADIMIRIEALKGNVKCTED